MSSISYRPSTHLPKIYFTVICEFDPLPGPVQNPHPSVQDVPHSLLPQAGLIVNSTVMSQHKLCAKMTSTHAKSCPLYIYKSDTIIAH